MDENHRIAELLREAGTLLAGQGANPFRVNAYLKAADMVDGLAGSLRDIYAHEGTAGLDALPGIGEGLASAIAQALATGSFSQLDRLRGTIDPVQTFRSVPGIGPDLAKQIHDSLHVDTLEALEAACRDGQLESVPGIGPRRAAAIAAAVTAMLDKRRALRRRPQGSPVAADPPVEVLLDVDREYRTRADKGSLPTIAPRRFNPEGLSWLPILHTSRGDWHFTALYSNTARAHELGRTRDWVVIYFYDDTHAERQHTVVTQTHGALIGKRVVRGREAECAAFHARG
jgi:DNA polymerase (family X)